MSRKVKEVVRAAGLRDELSFTSFRHGGFTKGCDAELTDREMLAQAAHDRQGAAEVREAHHQSDDQRHQEAPRDSNNKRSDIRMSGSPACPNGNPRMLEVLEKAGAGEGNRTLVFSLEGCCSTIELHPRER
jgi:hypothetical protein